MQVHRQAVGSTRQRGALVCGSRFVVGATTLVSRASRPAPQPRSAPSPACPCTVRTLRPLVQPSIGLRCQAASNAATLGGSKHRLELQVADQQMVLETGEIGRQANGAIMASMGDTVIYTTACASPSPSADGSFVPLTVSYAERFSAAGKTSGGYMKRDGKQRNSEVLISRLVDRPLRPMFTKGWANETQVLQWVLSYDDASPPEPLAITAAGAALLISDIPFQKAVAGVRVGWLHGAPVINPTADQLDASSLDLVLAGTKDALLMIEGYCQLLTEEQMMQAVTLGSQVLSDMCTRMEEWAQQVGSPKNTSQLVLLPEGLEQELHALVGQQLRDIYSKPTSKEERAAVESQANSKAKAKLSDKYSDHQIQIALKNVSSDIMRSIVLETGKRLDGRGLNDIRPITSRAHLLPKTHGSCLFTRGETQAIAVATLGSKSDAQRDDNMRRSGQLASEEPFYLHYFFPPSSVGEVGRVGGAPGRRELGHGELAQRALAPVIPSQNDFPYVVRVESTITESNGSSSMATVCGGCLAMLDAGVPLLRPVAGVAMGLILDQATGKFVVLSDILGTEDALGDMDFKVAGDDQGGLTAFQMDIKVEGITLDIVSEALSKARAGREHVLREMAKCDPPPRRKVANYAPHMLRLQIDPAKKVSVVGAGGRTVKQIADAAGVMSISVAEDGMLEIAAPNAEAAAKALDLIKLLIEPIEPGRIFRNARVSSIQAFGVFVEVAPAVAGLVHISELDMALVPDPASKFKVGDTMDVLVLDASNGGKLALSRRAALLADQGQPYAKAAAPQKRPAPATSSSDDSASSTTTSRAPLKRARVPPRQTSM